MSSISGSGLFDHSHYLTDQHGATAATCAVPHADELLAVKAIEKSSKEEFLMHSPFQSSTCSLLAQPMAASGHSLSNENDFKHIAGDTRYKESASVVMVIEEIIIKLESDSSKKSWDNFLGDPALLSIVPRPQFRITPIPPESDSELSAEEQEECKQLSTKDTREISKEEYANKWLPMEKQWCSKILTNFKEVNGKLHSRLTGQNTSLSYEDVVESINIATKAIKYRKTEMIECGIRIQIGIKKKKLCRGSPRHKFKTFMVKLVNNHLFLIRWDCKKMR